MFVSKLRGLARAGLLVAALATSTPAARAQVAEPVGTDGLVNALTYTGCAAGLAMATTFAMAWAALVNCGRVIAEEWQRSY